MVQCRGYCRIMSREHYYKMDRQIYISCFNIATVHKHKFCTKWKRDVTIFFNIFYQSLAIRKIGTNFNFKMYLTLTFGRSLPFKLILDKLHFFYTLTSISVNIPDFYCKGIFITVKMAQCLIFKKYFMNGISSQKKKKKSFYPLTFWEFDLYFFQFFQPDIWHPILYNII